MPKKASKEDFSKDLDLLGKLGVDTSPKKQAARTPKEQRILAGYEEVERFVEEHGRLPEHGENRDIFEQLYAVRLDRLRKSPECREVLNDIDTKRLLEITDDGEPSSALKEDPTDYELLNALGVNTDGSDDITELKHVRSTKEKQAAEEIGQRIACENFGVFKPLFKQVKNDIKTGLRSIIPCEDKSEVSVEELFIFQGQTAYIAQAGETFVNHEGRKDCRLRVIFDNGTESRMLRRSFQKRLWEDTAARRIISPEKLGPLFSDQEETDDHKVGYVYVLRSKSENEFIAKNRNVIHKIGITNGSVKKRVANAAKDPTYLLADVDIVETYKVSNLDLNKLEKLLHKFFDSARLDLQLKDRFGFDVEPREWFLVPLSVIEEAIQKIIAGTLPKFRYEPEEGKTIEIEE